MGPSQWSDSGDAVQLYRASIVWFPRTDEHKIFIFQTTADWTSSKYRTIVSPNWVSSSGSGQSCCATALWHEASSRSRITIRGPLSCRMVARHAVTADWSSLPNATHINPRLACSWAYVRSWVRALAERWASARTSCTSSIYTLPTCVYSNMQIMLGTHYSPSQAFAMCAM